MVHPTKTDSELMTKQKENKTDFLHTRHSQLLPQSPDRSENRHKK